MVLKLVREEADPDKGGQNLLAMAMPGPSRMVDMADPYDMVMWAGVYFLGLLYEANKSWQYSRISILTSLTRATKEVKALELSHILKVKTLAQWSIWIPVSGHNSYLSGEYFTTNSQQIL